MPEGVEVKIIGEELSKIISARVLTNIEVISGRYTKKPIPGLDLLTGMDKIIGVGTKGKLIFWFLEKDRFLLNTLGMTGIWSTDRSHKHARVRFDFKEGQSVYFVDTRNFGTIKIIDRVYDFKKKLSSLGPDMLSEKVDAKTFNTRIFNVPAYKDITTALMDQSVISGVGNYIKSESLYRARIAPGRLIGSLSNEEVEGLRLAIIDVMNESYCLRGASIKNYIDTSGAKGSATSMFEVYGRKKDPNGFTVEKGTFGDKRTTHWVPELQK